MEVDDEIRELILVGASALELKKKAIERGMITLAPQRIDQGSCGHDDAGRSGARNDSLESVVLSPGPEGD
jgi:hypothetical protein